jgi:hypothetical protein
MCEKLVPPDMAAVVMTIEEKFGITIPDDAAEKVRTRGQLHNFVLARVAHGQAQVCVTSDAFYRLRRALGDVCHVPRGRRPAAGPSRRTIPLHDRPCNWQELRLASLGRVPADTARKSKSAIGKREGPPMATWSSWKEFIPIKYCNGHSLFHRKHPLVRRVAKLAGPVRPAFPCSGAVTGRWVTRASIAPHLHAGAAPPLGGAAGGDRAERRQVYLRAPQVELGVIVQNEGQVYLRAPQVDMAAMEN